MNKCEEAGFQHLWKQTPHLTLDYRLDGLYDKHRKCENCGKEQIMELEWRDSNSNVTNVPKELGNVEVLTDESGGKDEESKD